MLMRIVSGTVILFIAALAAWNTPAGAQEPLEQLPTPKKVLPAPPTNVMPAPQYVPYPYPVLLPPPPRLDSRNAWSLFAPNSMGQMRLRVIQAPYGSYYLYNGEPYFGLSTRSPYILPRTTD